MSTKNNEEINEKIVTVDYNDEMQSSYIDYAMSVIVSRALPDVRDGLKPVQRRILYAMRELGLKHDGPFKKSARIVGDTMGKYHPHGDSSIYEAMVNLSKEWSLNHPLVDGHGNFGSIEGDGAAAMRYTEARLSKLSEEAYLRDLEKGVVDFIPNFDESEKEPSVLPVRIPNLLITGAEGIAVGMACKIPTHNLEEVIDATNAYISNPAITVEGLMEYVKGPDFATGGIIANADELTEIYRTGAGKVRVRGKVVVEEGKNGRTNLVVTEIPYTMIGAIDKFMSDVADMVRNKTTQDIIDIRNNSDKEGIRIVIELKRGANVERNINLLYKKARLEDTYGVNMLAVCDQKPEQMSLKRIIANFVAFSLEVNHKKYRYLLDKELEKKEIKEGLIRAYDCIDLIIEILRGSKNVKDAKECLMYGNTEAITFKHKESEADAKLLDFTEKQATAILEMRLQKLIGLEIMALRKEFDDCLKAIEEYTALLENPGKMKKKLQSELNEVKKNYSTPRKTVIANEEAIVIAKEEVKEQDYYILIDRFRYVKAVDEATYQRNQQNVETDYKQIVLAKNTGRILLLTDDGKCHQIKVKDIPVSKYKDKGIPLENISNLTGDENILYINSAEVIEKQMLLFVASNGMVKQVMGDGFISSKKTIDATKLADGATVVSVVPVTETDTDVVIGTKEGAYIRFKMLEVSTLKKTAVGVRGIKLKDKDEVNLVAIGDGKGEFMHDEAAIPFSRIKATKRDAQGTKLRF